MANRDGQQLGNYYLIRLLGRGGFAEVYLGKHIYLETQVAIKLLTRPMTPKDVQDFLKEARTVARLIHPNIVRVLDFGVDPGSAIPFLVMDYVPKGTLRHLYPIGTPLDSLDIVRYSKQIAAALQYAHTQKVIHRDVKPENMLVESNGRVVLSDFGIAVAIHRTVSRSPQEAAGTISYMAPEQINGNAISASDQYSLGVVIYEWLCGECPFTGTTYIEIAMQHLHSNPPSLCKKKPSISPAVEKVVLKALAKDPQRRFPRVQDFTDALEQALHPLSSLSPQWRIPRRIFVRGLIGLLATGVLVGGGVAIISSVVSTITSSGTMFGFDLQRTNFNPNENMLNTGNVSQLVSYWTTSTGGAILSSPVIANGTLYIGSNDHKLYALDASTGNILWTVTTGDAVYSSPAIANETVYVGSNDHKLYTLDASTGKVLWTVTTGDAI